MPRTCRGRRRGGRSPSNRESAVPAGDLLRGGCGTALLAGGLLLLVGGIASWPEPGAASGSVANQLLLLATLAGAPLALGGVLLGSLFRRLRTRRRDREQRAILAAAAGSGGRLTAVTVARQTDLSLEIAGLRLEELARAGLAQRDVDTAGLVYYLFPELTAAGPAPALLLDPLDEQLAAGAAASSAREAVSGEAPGAPPAGG